MVIVKYVALIVLILAVLAVAILFTPLGERPLRAVFSIGDVKTVDFATLKLSTKPNQFLMCPPDLCAAKPDADSPPFDLSAEQLRARWHDMVAKQPRVDRLGQNGDGSQEDYVQRTARFRFPDIITVRFIAISPSRSTLAIYSRSIYGRSDFGVNEKRIEAWLAVLRDGG